MASGPSFSTFASAVAPHLQPASLIQENPRLTAWAANTIASFGKRLAPQGTGVQSACSRLAGVTETMDDVLECVDTIESGTKAWASGREYVSRLQGKSTTDDSDNEVLRDVVSHSLSVVSGAGRNANFLSNSGVISLGESLSPVRVIGSVAGMANCAHKTHREVTELSTYEQGADSDEIASLTVAEHMINIAKNVCKFALSAFTFIGVVFGIAVGSMPLLLTSTALLITFIATHYIGQAKDASENAREESGGGLLSGLVPNARHA